MGNGNYYKKEKYIDTSFSVSDLCNQETFSYSISVKIHKAVY